MHEYCYLGWPRWSGFLCPTDTSRSSLWFASGKLHDASDTSATLWWHHLLCERTRMARVDLGQPGAPLPWAVSQLSLLSFTEGTQHVSFSVPVELVCVSIFARCHNTQASNSIHRINSITMPMRDVLLRHFRKMPFMVSIILCGCTLYVLLVICIQWSY